MNISKIGFDNQKYLNMQSEQIIERIHKFGGKLYLEFGGKLSICLSQVYNDAKRGLKSGYAKFETFPIWNISLQHLVNLATADLRDVNMIDPLI